jgi:acrylyl-CoA reductase (NADPH)
MGHTVVASTGRVSESDYLRELGAARIIDRADLASAGKPLQRERWSGVVDTVGSHTLANACASTRWNGAVAACGLAQGADFPSTVMPFILRAVTLYGINSMLVPNDERRLAWDLIARHVSAAKLSRMAGEIGLSDVIAFAPSVLEGRVRGRTVVDVNR